MKMDSSQARWGIRVAGLVGAYGLILGPIVFGTAASSPNI